MSESERGRAGRVERSESRGWSREEWTVARDRLTARGLIDPDDGTATEAGRSLRHQVERHTDQLAAAPWRFLGPDDRVMRPRGAAGVAAAALLLIAVSGCDPDTEGSAGPKENGGGGGAALAVAEALPVKGRAPKTGYDRDKFGSPWADTDSNSCDTRDDILKRDLADVEFRSGDCKVVSGVLDPDPYTGGEVKFVRGRSQVDIDHIVALSDAWQKGAQRWDASKRVALANDLMLAV